MWLKAFEHDGKLLSESEFWILTTVEGDFESPNTIMDRLIESTLEWTPKAGTVYPILHRLAEAKLLEKMEDGGLHFRRSHQGDLFLSSVTKPLRAQLRETLNYYQNVLRNLASLEPAPSRYEELLDRLSHNLAGFAKSCAQLSEKVKIKADTAHDVPITFED